MSKKLMVALALNNLILGGAVVLLNENVKILFQRTVALRNMITSVAIDTGNLWGYVVSIINWINVNFMFGG